MEAGAGDSGSPLLKRPPNQRRGRWVKQLAFILVVALHLGTSAAERVAFRELTVSMSPYFVTLHQLVSVVHLTVFAAVAFVHGRWDRSSHQLKRCPKHALLTMALLDTLHCVLVFYAGGAVPGLSQIILMQMAMPCAMVASRLALRTAFERTQAVGAIVVLVAVGACAADPNGAGAEGALDRVLFALACVPAALSVVYKRRRLMLQVIDCAYLNAWLAFFQFACGLVIGPLFFAFDEIRYGASVGSSDAREQLAHSMLLRNVDEGLRCAFFSSAQQGAWHPCANASKALGSWLLATAALAMTSYAIMLLGSVPALYLSEIAAIWAAAAGVTSQRAMGFFGAPPETFEPRGVLLLCITTAGLCVHHSAYLQHIAGTTLWGPGRKGSGESEERGDSQTKMSGSDETASGDGGDTSSAAVGRRSSG